MIMNKEILNALFFSFSFTKSQVYKEIQKPLIVPPTLPSFPHKNKYIGLITNTPKNIFFFC